MSSKERYLSKEEYKQYERFKSDIKAGRLLNPESLLCLAESVDNNPTRLGLILLKKIEKILAYKTFQVQSLDLNLPLLRMKIIVFFPL